MYTEYSHFGDVLPSQSLGLVLKKENKHNKSRHASVTKILYNIKLTQKELKPGLVAATISGLETKRV